MTYLGIATNRILCVQEAFSAKSIIKREESLALERTQKDPNGSSLDYEGFWDTLAVEDKVSDNDVHSVIEVDY